MRFCGEPQTHERSSDALSDNPLRWSVTARQLDLITHFVEMGTPIDTQRAAGHPPGLLAVSGATDYCYCSSRRQSHPSLQNTFVLVGSLPAQGANYNISVASGVLI